MTVLKRLVTISVPVLNEADNIKPLMERLRAVAETHHHYDFEFLFTDNASTDATFERLAGEARADNRIRVIRFTRNFGFQLSILTNYLNARGDAAIQIDADLQDPPELFGEFLAAWEQGYKVVYGIRRSRPENPLLSVARKLFYRGLAKLSSVDLPVDAGDFRLIDRAVIEDLRKVEDEAPYIRGVIAHLGYQQTGIPYDRAERVRGKSKFRLLSLIRLGVDGVCGQSTKPLELITLLGTTFSVLSLLGALFYFAWSLLAVGKPQGFATLVILILISTSVQTAFIGLLGEYIGRIFKNTRHIPAPIIDQRIEPLRARDEEDSPGPQSATEASQA
ncbi:glycosyltransferase family 2 protein [Bradyrhizobium sp.]|uniref:glycosyltransferase family 2 protein n=1 Tax=Bradyrhizobium sp. TaxID=376 RepID=UPI002D6C36AF|nr:glycosyltransferase family 2 protein [Bradyrhizobium sp.]HZR76016.1 glycosyltransferase family 2 protein [Bradyrhizobium sp.]